MRRFIIVMYLFQNIHIIKKCEVIDITSGKRANDFNIQRNNNTTINVIFPKSTKIVVSPKKHLCTRDKSQERTTFYVASLNMLFQNMALFLYVKKTNHIVFSIKDL